MFAIEFERGLEEVWTDIATFVPKLFTFLAVLIAGHFIAKALAKGVERALQGAGLEVAVTRSGLRSSLVRMNAEPGTLISRLIYWTLALIFLQLAFGIFGTNPVSDLISEIVTYLPSVVVAVIIVLITLGIAAAVRELVGAALEAVPFGTVVSGAAWVAVLAIGSSAALSQLHIAPDVVTGLFYAALTLIVGVIVIAVGGGGIRPLETRWRHKSRHDGSRSAGWSSSLSDDDQPHGHVDEQTVQVSSSATEAARSAAGKIDPAGTTGVSVGVTSPADVAEQPEPSATTEEMAERADVAAVEPYESHTHDELYSEAQNRNIPGRSDMDKATLINALRTNDGITEPYESHTHDELYSEAQDRNIPGRSDMDKATLINALRTDDDEDTP